MIDKYEPTFSYSQDLSRHEDYSPQAGLSMQTSGGTADTVSHGFMKTSTGKEKRAPARQQHQISAFIEFENNWCFKVTSCLTRIIVCATVQHATQPLISLPSHFKGYLTTTRTSLNRSHVGKICLHFSPSHKLGSSFIGVVC